LIGSLAGAIAGLITAKRVVAGVARVWVRFIDSVVREAQAAIGRVPTIQSAESSRASSIGWFLAAAGCASVCYAWVVTGGSFRFNHAEVFGSFYDYQAASFLEGRLDVPEEAIGGEAFEARGKLYGYFGPTPALLRLPFVAAGPFAQGSPGRRLEHRAPRGVETGGPTRAPAAGARFANARAFVNNAG
jgi:hypothetical protein